MADFVANNSKNFTLYYNILEYFRIIMKNHPSIARVTQGDNFDIDTDEFPRYPLGNVMVTNVRFQDKVTNYNVQLIVADKVKLKNNESVGTTNFDVVPFEGTDDVVDIHSNTLAILNDLISFTRKSEDAVAFTIDTEVNCVPFRDNFDNGLAGFVATFDVKVLNEGNACLFNLLLDNDVC